MVCLVVKFNEDSDVPKNIVSEITRCLQSIDAGVQLQSDDGTQQTSSGREHSFTVTCSDEFAAERVLCLADRVQESFYDDTIRIEKQQVFHP